MTFQEKLDRIIRKNNSLLCVGLDSDLGKIPLKFLKLNYPQFEFNKWIISQTQNLVCSYKPNSAFYEAQGEEGIKELKQTCDYLHKNHPDIPLILDAKRGDIGSSNLGYIKYAFDYLGVDAITLHPYLGQESLKPFLVLKKKGLFILCKTSNKNSAEFQGLQVGASWHDRARMHNISLYQLVAEKVGRIWNYNNNCMLVVGATYPDELKKIRKIVGDMTILVPGIGSQGGNLKKTLRAGVNSKKSGLIINSSRGVIFAINPRDAAMKIRNELNRYR